MKKSVITIVIFATLFSAIGAFVIPQKTQATSHAVLVDPSKAAKPVGSCTEGPGEYCLLEPLQIGTQTNFDKYKPDTGIGGYINIVIKVFIGVIGVLGVIMTVLGGIQYMSTDAISKKEGGKEMVSNAIFGLLLALVSFVILNTINPQLVEIRLDPKEIKSAQVKVEDWDTPAPYTTLTATIDGKSVSVNSNCTQASVNAAAADNVPLDKGKPWGTISAIKSNDDGVRSKLLEKGIAVNKSNCSTVGQSGCTSVYKLGDTAVTQLGKLKTLACGSESQCKLMLTGGTECWLHQSHQIGSGRVDLSASSELVAYVKSKSQKTCTNWIPGIASDGCNTGQAGLYIVGTTYLIKESDHYHIKQW
jgi:hypothetical protein